jgi:hypothetical protein
VEAGQWRVSSIVAAICLACAPSSRVEADRDLLRALHEKVILAHRQSNVETILEDEGADYVVANRGEVTRPTLEERRERLGSYLRRTTFSEYRDVTDPVVTISSDGSLGWVIVQVRATGIQTTESGEKEPVEFVSAWIELYEKRQGRWLRVGNVSNFKT